MIIKDFSGGLSIRKHPSLIENNSAQIAINIDNESHILKPTSKPVPTHDNVGRYWTYFNSENRVVSSITPEWWVEFRDVLYTATKSTKGSLTQDITIEAPTTISVELVTEIENLLLYSGLPVFESAGGSYGKRI